MPDGDTAQTSFDFMTSIAHPPSTHTPGLSLSDHRLSTLSPDAGSSLTSQHPSPPGLTRNKSKRSLSILARNKVSNLAGITSQNNNPSLRSATSSGSLSKQSSSGSALRPNKSRNTHTSLQVLALDTEQQKSQSPVSTSMNSPEKSNNTSKMHQTSSKVLRMTNDDRPFARDFLDLFSTLITSLPLTSHRVRFVKVEETFLSEEAITNLGSLKFSQSNRIPDPNNPTRWVVTTTTTTFSMAKEMARQVCQRFVDARLIEAADGKTYPHFPLKGGVWQLTPKGTQVLKRFCDRNGIEAKHIEPLLHRAQMQLLVLERESGTDKIISDKSTLEVVFRRMAGIDGPNLKLSTAQSDSDSVSEYASGLVGVKMARDRRVNDKFVPYTFTGKAASDWILDCCTTIDRSETYEICELFVKWQLMVSVVEDKPYARIHPGASQFQPTKHAIYAVTEKGQRVCGWLQRPASMSSEDSSEIKEKVRLPRDTNMNRLNAILNDAALRMLFREHLRASLCEENLNFYLDAQDFLRYCKTQQEAGRFKQQDAVKESLATAYGLYNSFLAAGAPSELNIDHALRNRLDNRMTQTETDQVSMRTGLERVVELIELASVSVAKLMASDSVPKFMRDPRYQSVIREHAVDISGGSRAFSSAPGPGSTSSEEKSLSRSNTTRSSSTCVA